MTLNDFGKLMESCQKVGIADVLKAYRKNIKQSTIDILGTSVLIGTSLTGGGGTRYWFICPLCQLRRANLYKHPHVDVVGCRVCLGLDYRKHRYSGMLESALLDNRKVVQ